MSVKLTLSDGKPKEVYIRRSILFGNYGYYKDTRRDCYDDIDIAGRKHCYKCAHKFTNSDMIYLSITEDGKRILTCQKCSQEHIKDTEGVKK